MKKTIQLIRIHLIMVMATLLLLGCGIQVPEDKLAFIGEWYGQAQGQSMYLCISHDGSIIYHRKEGGSFRSIDAPLQSFIGDDFEVGVGPMSTLFKVSTPPHMEDGRWKMTVDGVELVRKQPRDQRDSTSNNI